jgi:hypothetical protein
MAFSDMHMYIYVYVYIMYRASENRYIYIQREREHREIGAMAFSCFLLDRIDAARGL